MAPTSHQPTSHQPTSSHRSGSGRTSSQPERVRHSGPETINVPLPLLGTVHLSRPELAYVGGIVGLSALGLMEWPIALVIAGGHILSADRSSRTVQDLGEAMTEA